MAETPELAEKGKKKRKIHPIVRIIYVPRYAGHLLAFCILSTVMYGQGYSYWLWAALAFQGFIWTNIAYYINSHSYNPPWAETKTLWFDTFLLGCWLPVAHYGFWVVTTMVSCISMGNASTLGMKTFFPGLVAISLGALLAGYFTGYQVNIESSLPTTLMCMFTIFFYCAVLGFNIYYTAYAARRNKAKLKVLNKEMGTMNDLIIAASSSLDINEMMTRVCRILQQVFEFDTVALQLKDEKNKTLNVHSAYGRYLTDDFLNKLRSLHIPLDSRDSVTTRVFNLNEVFYRDDVKPEMEMLPIDREIYNANHFFSVIILPVSLKKQVIGVISFYSHYKNFLLDDEKIEELQRYVAQISIVINNGKLYRESEEAKKEVNEQKEKLQDISEQLSHYLSPQVYKSIFSGEKQVKIGAMRKRLTVFFSDITGFTELTDRIESEMLTSMLNNYLTEMSKIALDYGGTIDKYIGDAVMIFFGDPDTLGLKKDAIQCVKMAIEMRKRLLVLKQRWNDEGFPESMQVRFGINSGYCTVGNFGSEYRMDYTIIGEQVNLASRLETFAEPGQIIISDSTYLFIKEEIECRKWKVANLKGIQRPIQTYEVVVHLDEEL